MLTDYASKNSDETIVGLELNKYTTHIPKEFYFLNVKHALWKS